MGPESASTIERVGDAAVALLAVALLQELDHRVPDRGREVAADIVEAALALQAPQHLHPHELLDVAEIGGLVLLGVRPSTVRTNGA